MLEAVFREFHLSGAVRSVRLKLVQQKGESLFVEVLFVGLDGLWRVVAVKGGGSKLFRVETALKLLRDVRCPITSIDLSAWPVVDPVQDVLGVAGEAS